MRWGGGRRNVICMLSDDGRVDEEQASILCPVHGAPHPPYSNASRYPMGGGLLHCGRTKSTSS